ncbi:hypothetical protein BLOT_012427 [Blomia tropicalis]|nr:hypothetical protein BLOT_012427 [Blomia tropicalis]
MDSMNKHIGRYLRLPEKLVIMFGTKKKQKNKNPYNQFNEFTAKKQQQKQWSKYCMNSKELNG